VGIKIFLLVLMSLALESTAAMAEVENVDVKKREEYYEKAGMSYAKELWQKQDNSATDEKRSQKAETLSYSVRARTLKMMEVQLKRTEKSPRLQQEIYYRLGLLEEQQAESASRKSSTGNSTAEFQQHVRKAISWQEQSLKTYPNFRTDQMLFALGENYSHITEFKKAETYYERLVNQHIESKLAPDALLALGNLLFDRKNYAGARLRFMQILNTPDQSLHAYGYYKAAWCLFNETRYPEAMQALEAAITSSRQLGDDKKQKRLGVEDEAISDLVLFYTEHSNPNDAKAYFERVVGKEKARGLRTILAKRYFDQGQHENAKAVTRELLREGVPKKEQGQLQLVLLSVAEKTKDYALSLQAAKDLTQWITEQKQDANDPVQTEAEEYLRNYCLRAHYAAETLKRKDLWAHARIAYETYLNAFGAGNAEEAEIRFRYGGLLFQSKENRAALDSLNLAINKMTPEHKRHKEALQLRIQTIELANKEQRKQIRDSELLTAFDAFVTSYAADTLAPEAAFKAAELAKKLESPELVAARFRKVANNYPTHALAKSAVSNALAMLVQGGNWSTLKAESAALVTTDMDPALKIKLGEVQELAELKLVEAMEQKGQFKEAHDAYEKLLDQKMTQEFHILCNIRMAKIAEQKLNDLPLAVKHWGNLQKNFSQTKEAAGANLELARLAQALQRPERALDYFLAYAALGESDLHNQSLTNAAVLEEKLKKRSAAGDHFNLLFERLKLSKPKEAKAAREASCNNFLLATYKEKSSELLTKLINCSEILSQANDGPMWLARKAWAQEQLQDHNGAEQSWKRLAKLKLAPYKANPGLRPYIALGRIKNLQETLQAFHLIHFSGANEKPTVNIDKKSKALELLEAEAQALLLLASPKTQIEVQKIVSQAYEGFAETMETAGVPKALSDADKEALRQSFRAVANQLREKAKTFVATHQADRAVASVSAAEDDSLDPVAKQYF
jgi:hypothetical protein